MAPTDYYEEYALTSLKKGNFIVPEEAKLLVFPCFRINFSQPRCYCRPEGHGAAVEELPEAAGPRYRVCPAPQAEGAGQQPPPAKVSQAWRSHSQLCAGPAVAPPRWTGLLPPRCPAAPRCGTLSGQFSSFLIVRVAGSPHLLVIFGAGLTTRSRRGKRSCARGGRYLQPRGRSRFHAPPRLPNQNSGNFTENN